MAIHVTKHAIERFQERVAHVTDEEARIAMTAPIIELAATFGECFVRLPGGQRIAVKDNAVVTVLPSAHYKRNIRRVRGLDE